MRNVLVTGAAGFVGFHLTQQLLVSGAEVIGLNNLNDYYNVSLKQVRLKQLFQHRGFRFLQLDLTDRPAIADLFETVKPEVVVHLATQVGVQYSLTHPHAYVDSNLVRFVNILEGCRQTQEN